MKLALDHHFATAIATQLSGAGHDVVTAHERRWHELDDEPLLEACHSEQRSLLTNNVSDFVPIARRWADERRTHSGIVLHSDITMSRSTVNTGWFVSRLESLLQASPGDDAIVDRTIWLSD